MSWLMEKIIRDYFDIKWWNRKTDFFIESLSWIAHTAMKREIKKCYGFTIYFSYVDPTFLLNTLKIPKKIVFSF